VRRTGTAGSMSGGLGLQLAIGSLVVVVLRFERKDRFNRLATVGLIELSYLTWAFPPYVSVNMSYS